MVMDLTAEFVKQLNTVLGGLDMGDKDHVELIDRLRGKISSVMEICKDSEELVNQLLSKIEDNNKQCKDIVYVRKDENILAVVSRDVVKPTIGQVDKINIECDCLLNGFGKLEDNKGYVVVDSEENLRRLDGMLSNVVLGVYEHDYRCFEGFVAVIGLYMPDGYVYIIDGIRFREIIPQLRLLRCGVTKILTSQRGVEWLIRDYGALGCYQNFNIPESEVYIDWRIRPLSEVMCCAICTDLMNAVKKCNMSLLTERHEPIHVDEVESFMDLFNIAMSKRALVEDLIKLRTYLAKNNDESPQFVMTDTQLYQVILNMPENVSEFELLLGRMSSILRLHVSDFLIIINQKSKIFSIESLKAKRIEEIQPVKLDDFSVNKYRSFDCSSAEDIDETIKMSD